MILRHPKGSAFRLALGYFLMPFHFRALKRKQRPPAEYTSRKASNIKTPVGWGGVNAWL
jgi:hypothetical protein